MFNTVEISQRVVMNARKEQKREFSLVWDRQSKSDFKIIDPNTSENSPYFETENWRLVGTYRLDGELSDFQVMELVHNELRDWFLTEAKIIVR